MKKDAVTLIEILIVVIIMGILAAIAVPVYTNRIERTRGERAIANIEMIVDAMKMYAIKYGGYPSGSGVNGSLVDLSEINTELDLDLTDENFNYGIDFGEDVAYPRIRATRNSGSEPHPFIRYNYDLDGDPDDWDPASTWDWMP